MLLSVYNFWLNLFQKKWLPLHTLAASGEFYIVDALLKHNVDINAVDKVKKLTTCWLDMILPFAFAFAFPTFFFGLNTSE